MTSDVLQTPTGGLRLRRPTAGRGLRAWDAADEQLLDAAGTTLAERPGARVLVVDDQFGALSLGLAANPLTVVADSATLPGALALNGDPSGRPVANWLSPPDGPFDLVVLRIPRQADYLAWLLRWVNGVLAEGGRLIAGGMIKHLPDHSVAVFADAVETEAVLPARKKARVVICRAGRAQLVDWAEAWKGYQTAEGLQLMALPAVFARQRLDIGTRLLLPHVARTVAELPEGGRVLDLACGNGVLGVTALHERPDLAVTFSDVSSQAVASARYNVVGAMPDVRAEFHHADGIRPDAGNFDRILLNPPFHEGGVVGDHLAQKLFRAAARHLAPGGRLLIVGNRHLGYHRTLGQVFRQVRQLDADPKFVVFEAGRS
ncbi:class I SAM-dependent methyltransferase [Marinobacter sp. C2H3]|uniref:class I SAM-dependent methyltransferase n=1 Tax=Marinobacter sp. C2H3 TaxID=3119003 RepID=UPI00300EFEF1